MWKAAAIVGAIELFIYAVMAIVAMVRAGSGSGVWIPMLPVFWAILAFRLWIILRIADAFADSGSWQFVIVTAIFGFFLSMILLIFLGARSDSWKYYSPIVLPLMAHISSAALACCLVFRRKSNHHVQVEESL